MINYWTSLLSGQQKKKIFLLLLFSFIVNFLDIIGIYALSNYILLISNNFDISSIKKINSFFFNTFLNNENLVFSFSLFLIIFFFFKNILSLFLNKLKFKNIAEIALERCLFIFKKYYKADYEFHLDFNISKAIRNIQSQEQIGNLLNRFIEFTKEVTFLFLILTVILVNSYQFFFYVIFFGMTLIFLYYYVSKKNFLNIGDAINFNREKTIQSIEQSFASLKDIFNLNKLEYITHDFHKSHQNLLFNKYKSIFLISIPKFFLEFISILILIILTYVTFSNGSNSSDDLFGNLLFLGLAFYKSIPSINSIINFFSEYQIYENILRDIYSENKKITNLFSNNKKKQLIKNFKSEIKFEKIRYSYSLTKNKIQSLMDVNILIKKGKKIGLYGKTGSGKSTLINIVSGLLQPSSGKIYIDKKEITKIYKPGFIAVVPQKIYLFNTTIEKNITLEHDEKNIDYELMNVILDICQINEILEKKNKSLKYVISDRGIDFSGGETQRIGLARALYSKPSLLILDESSNALDKKTEKKIFNSLFKFNGNLSIIIISHNSDLIKKCDYSYVLSKGRVIKNA